MLNLGVTLFASRQLAGLSVALVPSANLLRTPSPPLSPSLRLIPQHMASARENGQGTTSTPSAGGGKTGSEAETKLKKAATGLKEASVKLKSVAGQSEGSGKKAVARAASEKPMPIHTGKPAAKNNALSNTSPSATSAATGNAAMSAMATSASSKLAVHQGRVRVLREGGGGGRQQGESERGPVIYWMSRDQRSCDNWALIYAVQQAQQRNVSVAVAFNLVDSFLGAKARHFGFMLRGLQKLEGKLNRLGIPFFLFQGVAEQTIPSFVHRSNASLLVTDFSPLRIGRHWREAVVAALDVLEEEGEGEEGREGGGGVSAAVHEVDAHNVVPMWIASDKLEYAARTIRTKIHRQLPTFLVEYPVLSRAHTAALPAWRGESPPLVEWQTLIDRVISDGAEVAEVTWICPGEDAAMEALTGPNGFLQRRLKGYDSNRNDPSKGPTSLSGLSPWLHYGHISAQRCAFEAQRCRGSHPKAVDAFVEELVVRRELSDNFCFYQPKYDSVDGAWDWARTTLNVHRHDKREHVYSYQQLEAGKTHDELWNAAQLEMVYYGKMHGFMRMYWAKKILEWTASPEQALEFAIKLNDKFSLDGRDPNGYVGCMWSICGVHDQGWAERAVFGKIRYMNYAGCKRKFDIGAYVSYVNRMVAGVKRAAAQKAPNGNVAAAAAGKGAAAGKVTATQKLMTAAAANSSKKRKAPDVS